MDFDEGNYKIWKIAIYCLLLIKKNIMYEDATRSTKMKYYGLFRYMDAEIERLWTLMKGIIKYGKLPSIAYC